MGVTVVKRGIWVLGIHFDAQFKEWEALQKTTKRVMQKLELWSGRKPILEEKVRLLKAVILPVIVYTGLVFSPACSTAYAIKRSMRVYVWGLQQERLAQNTLYKQKKHGARTFPDAFLFTMAKYISLWCNLAVGGESKMACFV